MKYFDRALEILRERGEHESVTYVNTLVSIVVNMMQGNDIPVGMPEISRGESGSNHVARLIPSHPHRESGSSL